MTAHATHKAASTIFSGSHGRLFGTVRRKLSTEEALNTFAKYRITPVSIKQFTEFGHMYGVGKDDDVDEIHVGGSGQTITPSQRELTTIDSTNENVAIHSLKFLREEIPVRLAHMLKEIDRLPSGLLNMPSVSRVRGWYTQSFEDFVRFPAIEELEKLSADAVRDHCKEFTGLVKRVLDRHSPVVMTMAQGINELKQSLQSNEEPPLVGSLQYFLDRFYMSRIGIRMLLSQHVHLHEGSSPGWVGAIDEHCDIRGVARDAAVNARFLCEQNYCTAPEVKVHTKCDQKITFPYVPAHLYHMIFELLKNSMRAVMEHHGEHCTDYPKINIIISKGTQDLTIKITDEGGGIPHADMVNLFTYLYTTAQPPPLEDDMNMMSMNNAPLAGYGYGLPLSRLYARYFGGDLQVISMEGFGSDAYIYLKVASEEASEIVPSFNFAATQHYDNVSQQVQNISNWQSAPSTGVRALRGNLSQSLSPAYVCTESYEVSPETHPEFLQCAPLR